MRTHENNPLIERWLIRLNHRPLAQPELYIHRNLLNFLTSFAFWVQQLYVCICLTHNLSGTIRIVYLSSDFSALQKIRITAHIDRKILNNPMRPELGHYMDTMCCVNNHERRRYTINYDRCKIWQQFFFCILRSTCIAHSVNFIYISLWLTLGTTCSCLFILCIINLSLIFKTSISGINMINTNW